MSSIMIVGGDKLGAIPDHLTHLGFETYIHISGRKTKMITKSIPPNVDIILVLTDYINHNLAKKMKKKAQQQSIPICFSRRSWCAIYQTLTTCEHVCSRCPFIHN
ncbi:DUF2325 domain-containing protein [Evansella halocellulosilytica]|uniref:DUF2325 domain-containing protein n=1 Tax=Evansella halocellulosilytica TaxID=2011013 RepID=UPI000BB8077F|nr:DUF2325 domain-containing protein [Evansella halocellulosilytica]